MFVILTCLYWFFYVCIGIFYLFLESLLKMSSDLLVQNGKY